MKYWDDVFQVWNEYNPFLHRRLITKNEIAKWAEELHFVRLFGFVNNEFHDFFNFLEENQLMIPLTKAKRGSEFGYQMHQEKGTFFVEKPTDKWLEEVENYYHPFQFFQFILYYHCYKTNSISESIYRFYKRKCSIRYYVRDKKTRNKKISKIEIEQNKWIRKKIKSRFKGYNKSNKRSKDRTKKEKKHQKKKNKKDMRDALRNKSFYDPFLSKLRGFRWLNSEFLKIWIKLDSLAYYKDYIITPNAIDVSYNAVKCSPHNVRRSNSIFQDFNKWRERILAKRELFLNSEEFDILKQFYKQLEISFIDRSDDLIDGLQSMQDLFDIIPNNKLKKINGFTNFTINILSIRRFLSRISWALFGYNLETWPRGCECKQPYYYLSEGPEVLDYRNSVLGEFNLFTTVPFTLYVEGGAEVTIIKEFASKKFGLKFLIENMVGVENIIHFKRVSDSVAGRIVYFFIDFHTLEEFNSKKEKYDENCSFFFPDFITENFSTREFFRAFKLWACSINLNLNDSQKNELTRKLEQEKQSSNIIIQEYESGQEILSRPTNGYEKVLINFLRKYFPIKIAHVYPQISLDENNRICTNDEFESLVKEEIATRLKKLVSYSMKKDSERKNFQYPFERKLTPLYTRAETFIYRNRNLQYNLENP